jgi:hypothetical protein
LLGSIDDFLFDDRFWMIRYVSVRVGTKFAGRHVLLPPAAIRASVHPERVHQVALTREQVRGCPDFEEHQPVSRQYEFDVHRHYGLSPYWKKGVDLPPPPTVTDSVKTPADRHLRSVREVIGYQVSTADGQLGHAEDFLLDDRRWRVLYVVVNTRRWFRWLPGYRVLVARRWVRDVLFSEHSMVVHFPQGTQEPPAAGAGKRS